jgi:Protein of unknown function (DUF3761)
MTPSSSTLRDLLVVAGDARPRSSSPEPSGAPIGSQRPRAGAAPRAAPASRLVTKGCCRTNRQVVQPGTAGELPRQSFGVFPVIGEVVSVITPPRRKMPPALRAAALALTGVLVRVVAVESMAAIPPPCAAELVLAATEVLVVVADGTYSFSQHRSGTCSDHGGVHWWTGNLGAAGPGAH